MRLRIVAGSLGGRFIEVPRGGRTRPTAERVREAWMSAIGDRLVGVEVADLFAGSGALGIEALSRGAARAHFVESNRAAAATLRRNVAAMGLEDRAIVVQSDVFRYLSSRSAGTRWDIALADPPYAGGLAARLAADFLVDTFARELWIEHGPDAGVPGERATWTRRYGDSVISRLAADDAPRTRGGSE
jgi:16S rRNA (guanine966-N2)-methyltransferase